MSPEYRCLVGIDLMPGIPDALAESLTQVLAGRARVTRTGKIIDLTLTCPNKTVAEEQLHEMIDTFFANRVYETGRILEIQRVKKSPK